MDVVVERCAGLDVHRDNVVATARFPSEDRRQWELVTQTFRTTLAGLAELAAWLAGFGVTRVGMESTGVYWKTVFYALEDRFECWLLNAQHLRNVPGRFRAICTRLSSVSGPTRRERRASARPGASAPASATGY